MVKKKRIKKVFDYFELSVIIVYMYNLFVNNFFF